MLRSPSARGALGLLLAASLVPPAGAQAPQGTAFTYQGRLSEAGVPAQGPYDFQFTLYDAAVGGTQQGPVVTHDDVDVGEGLFSVPLDFGSAFFGAKRFLEMAVRPGGSSGAYTVLAPRQELTASPSALYSAATPWTGVSAKPPGFADDVDDDVLGGLPCAPDELAKWNGGSWACAPDADSGGTVVGVTAGLGLSGGTITTSGTLAVEFAGSGSASLAARSDHHHLGASWSGATGAAPGLSVESTTAHGIYGRAAASTGGVAGVFGETPASDDGFGVLGWATATSGAAHGVQGRSDSSLGYGVYGHATATDGVPLGVFGDVSSQIGVAVFGRNLSPVGGIAVTGSVLSGTGVFGLAAATTGSTIGIAGQVQSPGGSGVFGRAEGPGGPATGVAGHTYSSNGHGVLGLALATAGQNYAIRGKTYSSAGFAGVFEGDVLVVGTLMKTAGSFKIDHPLDPENKYLSHSFVESPDMKNVYDGLATTDAEGFAAVELPDWFEALNRDFRYQLTVLGDGAWARARVFSRIEGNRFVIQTDQPWIEVSWQVTGIRQDAYAEKHRIPVEEWKPEAERGTYLNPEAWGQPADRGFGARTLPPLPTSPRLPPLPPPPP
jgi:hypothetical protein